MTNGNVARKRACRAWRARANLRPLTRRRSRATRAGDEHEGLTTHGPHGPPGGQSARRIMCVCMPARRRTESPTAADRGPKSPSLRGSKGRQAAPDRVSSVGADWVKLVYTRLIRQKPKDPRTGKVLGRLPFDDGSVDEGSMPEDIDLLGVTAPVQCPRQRVGKGVDPPFRPPSGGVERLYC